MTLSTSIDYRYIEGLKMKLYQTKNVLFYQKPTIVGRLMQLCDRHFEKYKRHPKRIYMTKKEWEAYEYELRKSNVLVAHSFDSIGYPRITKRKAIPGRVDGIVCLTFRGIPVVKIEDWKELIKK